MKTVYKDFCGEEIEVPLKSSINSGVLQVVHQSLQPFIEGADSIKFKNGFRAMELVNDSLFILSQQAADQGARIICWSEANGMAFPSGASELVERGKAFAAKNKVYLEMAMAVLHPGKITPGKKFLENEAILIGPDGQVLNVFHKNNPVPMAEASEPGDGRIPVAASPWGNISTSICYDADFPGQMRQTSKNNTGLLLLPSGDWYAIDPYHSYMAIFRGIENGCSIVRQVSGGLSVASDYRGRINASLDFYDKPEKLWIADIPVGHVFTIYSVIGDTFSYLCIAVTSLFLVIAILKTRKLFIRKRKQRVE
jgi:apolipoprotein N-acyltransferase